MPYALLSASDKSDLDVIGGALASAGYTLLSTGGTARVLRELGLTVVEVSDHTGAPEMMDGRVKTLHPRVHGGILGDRVRHAEEAREQQIPWIDVVVANLYPFEAVTAAGAGLDEAIEAIDIGGPTMVRAAAKNHRHVVVVVDPGDYGRVAEALATGGIDAALRRELAVKAFRHTARYDAVIAGWLADEAGLSATFPESLVLGLERIGPLRYGENPHQGAAFYADADRSGRSLARLVQHQGKELSFNNLADLDSAVRIVFEHEGSAAVVVKHMNPCGCATDPDPASAFLAALAGDPVSAYGGIIAFNRPVDEATVAAIRGSRTFFEVLVAPGFTPGALERLASREKLRVISLPGSWGSERPRGRDARRVQGGWLLQDWDLDAPVGWEIATVREPSGAEAHALRFAWATARGIRSNAIAIAQITAGGASLNGVGAGQMSRVDSVRIAVSKATCDPAGGVLASDAFFPFPDGVEVAAEAGIRAIIQPGGSIRDAAVVEAADAAGIAMVFTGTRHFRH